MTGNTWRRSTSPNHHQVRIFLQNIADEGDPLVQCLSCWKSWLMPIAAYPSGIWRSDWWKCLNGCNSGFKPMKFKCEVEG